jgi:hypothetical protein
MFIPFISYENDVRLLSVSYRRDLLSVVVSADVDVDCIGYLIRLITNSLLLS